MIIPSIDLMDGKAVQLKQGKSKVLERQDVLDLALEFRKYGELAVIDLDAALGKGNNTALVKDICKIADCRVGGGIRTVKKAYEILRSGAKKIIIGTKAEPRFLKQLPKERLIAAIDVKNNYVASEGWTKNTGEKPEDVIKQLENYCSEFLFTDIEREGLMQGFDFKRIAALKKLTKNKITAAGGITSIDEIKKLENLGINSQIGMSIYKNKIKLDEAFISLLDFSKNNCLMPTIAQDDKKQVLMLAFSTKESLLKTFRTNKATYYSRSKKKLWTKGETSGNFQELIKARYDCDRDCLLFTVMQKNSACHTKAYSCFGEKEFELEDLYDIILDRLKNPKEESYTSKLLKNEDLIKRKIKEEAYEVINYKDENNLVWEIADLMYFVMVLMAKKRINIMDVKNELWSRRK
ncbi:MAG: bifunctional phosphoribosyl-AMP cyclohydrolase/phosphoribosyl-ATP diphosphatase HisIE [Candidatus Woesearchaeota archaeon]|nr:bifunctional phosphoribosyl-AMP cyclohydrolase/phosphoribosyl-ATP diphosphatase HisIE [Candidatus Woesearchaeota archaeon]